MDNDNNDNSINEVLFCTTTHFDENAFINIILMLGLALGVGSAGLSHLREAIYMLRQLRSAVPSTGLVQSTRTDRPGRCAGMKYFVTLTFPSLPPLHYKPPDATTASFKSVEMTALANNNIEDVAYEYCVSWKEFQEAIKTGQVVLLFHPATPGVPLTITIQNCNFHFLLAYKFGFLTSLVSWFVIGGLVSLFQNEFWCNVVDIILILAWFIPAAVCIYYRYFDSHHHPLPLDSTWPLRNIATTGELA
jgi:hypothetical protein